MGTIGIEELAICGKTEGGDAVAVNGGKEKIFVSVRIRPLNAREIERNDPCDWECVNDTTIVCKSSSTEKSLYPTTYTYDRTFGCESSTRQVYEEAAKEVALSVVNGINSSIFAYGQTSSGKTYTMCGITEYTILDIYDYVKKHEEREFVLKFSAMEIYNEAVRDLLGMDNTPLRLLDDPERGTIVEKLTEEKLRDQNHLKELLSICAAQRQIGETSLNEASSRSHQILRLTIESSARNYVSRASASTLAASVNFVDLAGSERASQTAAAGARLKEGSHINRSLLTLGTVIRKLSKGRNSHVPYRDSKLTRILQSSLGGNARTAIICTMSPAHFHIEQTRNTLLFASCAKEVVTNARINVVMSDKELVKHLRRELLRLENELKNFARMTPHDALKDKDTKIKEMEWEIKELMNQRDIAQSRLEQLFRAVGDDESSRHWDGSSQSSISHGHSASEDTLSLSDVSSVTYQDSEFYTTRYDLYSGNNNLNENHLDASNGMIRRRASHKKSMSNNDCSRTIPDNTMVEIPHTKTRYYSEQFQEAKCSGIDGLNSIESEEFNLLLPLTDEDKLERADIKPVDHTVKEQEVDSLALIHGNLNNSFKDDPSPIKLQRAKSLEILELNRTSSCKDSTVMSLITSSLEKPEKDNKASDDSIMNEVYEKPELCDLHHDADKKLFCRSQSSERHSFSGAAMVQDVQNPHERFITQIEIPKQLTHDKDSRPKEAEKLGVDALFVVPSSAASPLAWESEFEKKQMQIIELWHECYVSLVHRTCFFLLFKGDPADAYYMEVEYRRLSFLKNSFSNGKSAKISEDGDKDAAASSSLKQLRREREMLQKQMLKKLSAEERKNLYIKWGVLLKSKQRRVQVAKLLWTSTDIEHVKESASVVATLIGLPIQGDAAVKEMFGLSFTPQRFSRRSFSWLYQMPSFS